MLDIYFVAPSCSAMPKDPSGLAHAASIDIDAHRSLAAVFDQCRRAGAGLAYFNDSLLSPDQVMTMLRVLDANADASDAHRGQPGAFTSFRRMLAHAAEQGMGLAAFCD